MSIDQTKKDPETLANKKTDGRDCQLTPEARRALAEAAARRRKVRKNAAERPVEQGGREGPDPVRYGDWEKAGIVSDF